MKFGIYEDYGTNTCAGYPGIIGHMETDAQTFAEWGVDYVKLDGCYANITDMDEGKFFINFKRNQFVYSNSDDFFFFCFCALGYPEFGRLLNATGRPMVYSCSWPVYQEEEGLIVNFNLLITMKMQIFNRF